MTGLESRELNITLKLARGLFRSNFGFNKNEKIVAFYFDINSAIWITQRPHFSTSVISFAGCPSREIWQSNHREKVRQDFRALAMFCAVIEERSQGAAIAPFVSSELRSPPDVEHHSTFTIFAKCIRERGRKFLKIAWLRQIGYTVFCVIYLARMLLPLAEELGPFLSHRNRRWACRIPPSEEIS